ncbi:MAG: hypothetical protein IJU84_03930, partial [Clostridia bacterium]|nr:hypothetical protein [Clostridia bacterium]
MATSAIKTKHSKTTFKDFLEKMEQLTVVRAIRGGLLTITPVLIIGAFALLIKTFPITAYQNFITGFANGLVPSFLDFVF